MASGERRLGTFRRGMTVLGKIPTPSVPKPINLPSQRLENQGLESSVEIVPRGTFSWGNAGNSNAAGDNKAVSMVIMSSPPTSTGVWNGGIKVQGHSTSANDQPSSFGTGTRPLSAPSISTTTAWGHNEKTQANVHMQSSGFTVIPVDSITPVSKASADSLPQHNDALFNQPTSANATRGDLDKTTRSGFNVYADAGSGHVSCREGSQGHGDDQRTFVRQGTPPTGSELPAGVVVYPGHLAHEAYFRSSGSPHYCSPHDTDTLLINNPGVYESYRSHLTPAERFSQSNLFESHAPQIRHVEQFATLGNFEGVESGNMHMRRGFFPSGNKLLCQETEIPCDSGQDSHKYGDGNFGTGSRDQGYFGTNINADANAGIFSIPPHGNEYNHVRPRNFRRANRPKEAGDFLKEEVSSLAMQVPEKKIILLTKAPRDEAKRADMITNISAFLPDSEGCKETGLSNFEVESQSTENVSILSMGKGVKTFEEVSETTKVAGSEMRQSTKAIRNFQIVKQDIKCVNENSLTVETGINKLQLACMNTPLTASSGNERTAELKVQAKHDSLVDAYCHRGKSAKRTSKVSISGGLDPVGGESAKRTSKVSISGGLDPVGGDSVCKMPAKQIVAEGVAQGDDERLKNKATNHKSERAWRPKSPLVDSVPAANAPGPQVARGENTSERNYRKAMVREEPSQECSTGSMTLAEAPSSLQTQKAHIGRNMHCLPSSLRPDSNSKVEASSLLIDSVVQHAKTSEGDVDRRTECGNEGNAVRDTLSSQACNSASSVSEHFSAEAFNFMETEGSYRKAKGRPSYHKAEKEWRPKSPAVEIMSVTDSIAIIEAGEINSTLLPVCEKEMQSNHHLKTIEQEGPQALDAYDYEGQRARMKEIAAQRAKQRQKEEEERAREQKAKALAKLEELERRKLANSTSMNEQATKMLMDESPKRKTKKRLNPTKDVSMLDLEKQQSDEALISDPSKSSTPARPIVENKEVANNKERVVHASRNTTDGFDSITPKITEENKVHEPVSAASSSQMQRRIWRKDSSMHQEDLPLAQHLEAGLLPGEKHGMNKDEMPKLGRSRRQKGAIHNQVGHVALNSGNGRKSTLIGIEGQKELKLSPLVSQPGNQCQGNTGGKGGWSLQSSAEELKEAKIGELLASEEQPLALCTPDKNSGLCLSSRSTGRQQSSVGDSRHKQRVNMETKLTVEQAETTATSNANFVAENVGRLHASWRQKNLSVSPFFLNSDNSNSDGNKNMQNGLEESLAIQPMKSYKLGRGGKQLSHGLKGPLQLEGCEVKERMTVRIGSIDSELTHLNATCDAKHEEEMVAAEQVKGGQSCDLWRRPKNGKIVSPASNQSFMKESNTRHSAHLGTTDEAECQEIIDSFTPVSSQTSCPHNLKVNAKLSPKGDFGASQWHKSRSMKSASKPAPSLGKQTGSLASLEEPLLVSASWLPMGSSVLPSNQELQDTANRQRRRGPRFQAEAKPPLETSTSNPKYQEIHLVKGAEVESDPLVNGKNRSNHTNFETRTGSRQHHSGFRVSRSYDHQHQAAVSEHSGEQRPSRRGNKLPRQRQFNGCSTAAELDRRDAKPAIKTGVSC